MINTTLLNSRIKESGLSKSFIASKMGINLNSLQNKITGKTAFRDPELMAAKKTLALSDSDFISIFFADDVYPEYTSEV